MGECSTMSSTGKWALRSQCESAVGVIQDRPGSQPCQSRRTRHETSYHSQNSRSQPLLGLRSLGRVGAATQEVVADVRHCKPIQLVTLPLQTSKSMPSLSSVASLAQSMPKQHVSRFDVRAQPELQASISEQTSGCGGDRRSIGTKHNIG